MSVYASITPEIIEFIRPWAPHGICEIGAGDGTWIDALNAAGIVAAGYDIKPRGPLVCEGDHTEIAKHVDRAFLAVWPPDGSAIQQWIKTYHGNTVILCGSQQQRFDLGDALDGFVEQASIGIIGGVKGNSVLTIYDR